MLTLEMAVTNLPLAAVDLADAFIRMIEPDKRTPRLRAELRTLLARRMPPRADMPGAEAMALWVLIGEGDPSSEYLWIRSRGVLEDCGRAADPQAAASSLSELRAIVIDAVRSQGNPGLRTH